MASSSNNTSSTRKHRSSRKGGKGGAKAVDDGSGNERDEEADRQRRGAGEGLLAAANIRAVVFDAPSSIIAGAIGPQMVLKHHCKYARSLYIRVCSFGVSVHTVCAGPQQAAALLKAMLTQQTQAVTQTASQVTPVVWCKP